jgi:pyruvate dehydrogenase E1 component beta subunit
MHAPGIKVVMPSSAYEAKGLLKTAFADPNPVLFLEHKKLYQIKGEVPEEEYRIPFGKAAVAREGRDATVVATSYTVRMALEAAQVLSGEGIQIEVIDPRTLVPLDEQAILASVRKTGRLIVVHEAWRRAGAGAEIAAIVAEKGFSSLKAPIARVAAEDVPIPFSPVLEQFVLPNAQKIILAVRKAVTQ